MLEPRVLLSADVADDDHVHVLWAPDTPLSVVEAAEAEHDSHFAAVGDPNAGLFEDHQRWSRTATDGWGLEQGDPTVITWSIMPDGTNIAGFNGEPSAPSDLMARLDEIYGSQSTWFPLFQSVFDRWDELSGITFVYEPNDDGATLSGSNRGVLGVRGDIRIGGHYIDGNGGTLAYNFYPNSGDMVIDTADNFFNSLSNNSIRLRNTLAHEIGHGLGMGHTAPTNGTKLLEPYLRTSFDGPQFNDILSVQRGYGDTLEDNDTAAAAHDLGSLFNDTAFIETVSIDDDSDVDYYRFTITQASVIDITLDPFGPTYSLGEQGGSTSTFNASTQSDLALTLFASDGATVIVDMNQTIEGESESIAQQALDTPGTYFVRVTGNSNFAQMYELSVSVMEPAPPNQPPVANDDAYELEAGQSLNVAQWEGVLNNDWDNDGDPLWAALVDSPAYASDFYLNADGSFNYSPIEGFEGTDTFTYQAYDDADGSTGATVTLTVHPAPDPPTVLQMSINGGDEQRSTVSQVVFVFDQNVVIQNDALEVRNQTTGQLLDSAMVYLDYDASTYTAVFTFGGPEGDSLADGDHEIRLLSQALEGAPGQLLAGNVDYVAQVHRLFGDVDGDRDVDAADLFDFRLAYDSEQSEQAFDDSVDHDADGDVDAADLFQFRMRFGTQLDSPPAVQTERASSVLPTSSVEPTPLMSGSVPSIASLLAGFSLERLAAAPAQTTASADWSTLAELWQVAFEADGD